MLCLTHLTFHLDWMLLPIVSCASAPSSAIPTATLVSVTTGGSSVQRSESGKCLCLYKTTKIACWDYVAVKGKERVRKAKTMHTHTYLDDDN